MKSLTDITAHSCGPTTSIRQLLKRIDMSSYLFQIILDGSGRLLGTVTDGDIRRAMLHGVGLDDPASACMHKNPTTGIVGDHAGNRKKLKNLGSTRSFLPILNPDGMVAEVQLSVGSGKIGRALVMAGGAGTRLGERTRTTPKPLLAVGGRPILDRVLAALEAADVGQIVISVHYLAEQIRNFIAMRDNKAAITFILEPHQLGTAGALGLLDETARQEPLLVVNGDVITDVDFTALHEFHERLGYEATVAVARHEVDIPFGVIRYGEDGLLDRIDEKPKVNNFIAAGVYYLSPEYLSIVPSNRKMDMPELLNTGRQIGLRAGLFPIHEYWTDVGHPGDLELADRLISKNRP